MCVNTCTYTSIYIHVHTCTHVHIWESEFRAYCVGLMEQFFFCNLRKNHHILDANIYVHVDTPYIFLYHTFIYIAQFEIYMYIVRFSALHVDLQCVV